MEKHRCVVVIDKMSKDELADLLASHQGRAPTGLLAALSLKADPLSAVETVRWQDEIWSTVVEDFGILAERPPPNFHDDATGSLWLESVSWLVAGIAAWSKAEDERLVVLSALLITADICGGRRGLWELLPDDFAPSSDFLDVIERYVAQRKIVFEPRGGAVAPIWEREFVDAFQQADSEGDWPKVATMWPSIEQANYRQGGLMSPLAFLTRYGFERLVRAANAIEQVAATMGVIDALPPRRRLSLALASPSHRVRFCVTMHSVRVDTRRDETAYSLDKLTELLVKVAARSDEWRKWMKAFNAYPSRYPHLHKALGKALAMSSPEAMLIYLESVSLQPSPLTMPDEGRKCVSDCLRTFDECASESDRALALAKAYQLWNEWGFASLDPGIHLTGVNRCALDYAIVRYIEVYMDEGQRQATLSNIRQNLSKVDVRWHATEVDCYNEWNRLLSLFQPHAHAISRQERREDALTEKVYYPFDPTQSLYHVIQFHMTDPIRNL